jgi:hypothetical protein
MIIFSLIKTNSLRNNELFKRNLTLSKGNRIIKMGSLFLTSSLTLSQKNSCTQNSIETFLAFANLLKIIFVFLHFGKAHCLSELFCGYV